MRLMWVILGSVVLFGCAIEPTIELVSKQTALERQLMGSMADLDKQALIMTPIRGEGASQVVDPYRKAIAGRAFRLDEIDAWLVQGYLAEHEAGFLKETKDFPHNHLQKRFKRLVKDENRDRLLIIKHLIHNSADLSSTDHVKMGFIFHRLRLKDLPNKAWVEKANGQRHQVLRK